MRTLNEFDREQEARNHRLQELTGWHYPDVVELAKLEYAIRTMSEEQWARVVMLASELARESQPVTTGGVS